MKLSHINNVVLYAKNWYVHTGDVFKDMQKHVLVDHPDADVSTEEKLCEIMVRDRNEWVDSITEYDGINVEHLKSKSDSFGVAWENNPYLAKIWACLCEYSSFISNYFDDLEPPFYDRERGFIPQKNISTAYENPWLYSHLKNDATDKEYEDAAALFMSKSLEKIITELCQHAIFAFDYEKCSEILRIHNSEFSDVKYTFKKARKAFLLLQQKIIDIANKQHSYFEVVNDGLFYATVNFHREPSVAFFIVPVSVEVGGVCCVSAENIMGEYSAIIKMCADEAISLIDRNYCRQLFDTDKFGIDESVDEHLNTIYECVVPYQRLCEMNPNVENGGSMLSCGLFTIESNFDKKHGVRLSMQMCESYGCIEGLRNGILVSEPKY